MTALLVACSGSTAPSSTSVRITVTNVAVKYFDMPPVAVVSGWIRTENTGPATVSVARCPIVLEVQNLNSLQWGSVRSDPAACDLLAGNDLKVLPNARDSLALSERVPASVAPWFTGGGAASFRISVRIGASMQTSGVFLAP